MDCSRMNSIFRCNTGTVVNVIKGLVVAERASVKVTRDTVQSVKSVEGRVQNHS
jgi:hypothetical protein